MSMSIIRRCLQDINEGRPHFLNGFVCVRSAFTVEMEGESRLSSRLNRSMHLSFNFYLIRFRYPSGATVMSNLF
jgi:hypothetical protein